MSVFPHLPTQNLPGVTLNFEKLEALLKSWGMSPSSGPIATVADLDRLQRNIAGGAIGKEGPKGEKGANGETIPTPYPFKFEIGLAKESPVSGFFKKNNTVPTTTRLFVSNNEAHGESLVALFTALNTVGGLLVLEASGNFSAPVTYSVLPGGVKEEGTYQEITVKYVTGSVVFHEPELVYFYLALNGEKGPAGAEGPKGTTGAEGPKGTTGETGARGTGGDTFTWKFQENTEKTKPTVEHFKLNKATKATEIYFNRFPVGALNVELWLKSFTKGQIKIFSGERYEIYSFSSPPELQEGTWLAWKVTWVTETAVWLANEEAVFAPIQEGATGTPGAEGPKGATGEYKNTGAWTAKAARTKGDTVTRNGSTFACIKTVAEGEDKEPGTAPTIWEVMAEKGATGAEGPKGTTGAEGPKGEKGATGESLKPVVQHAFAVNGTLVEEELPGMDVITGGTEQKLVRLDLRLVEGTSVEVELKRLVKGEGAAELLKKIKVSKGTPVYETLETTLNDKDYLFISLVALVGTPKKLSYTFGIKQFT